MSFGSSHDDLRVWAGDTLTVHAESYKGLVADALVAKLVTAPTGGVTLPALSAAGTLVVRFNTDAKSEGFYNAAADGAEDNDGFVASFKLVEGCSGPGDCGGQACDSDGECACAAAGRGGADCSHAHCMGTSVVATPGTLRSHAAYGVGSYDDDAECELAEEGQFASGRQLLGIRRMVDMLREQADEAARAGEGAHAAELRERADELAQRDAWQRQYEQLHAAPARDARRAPRARVVWFSRHDHTRRHMVGEDRVIAALRARLGTRGVAVHAGGQTIAAETGACEAAEGDDDFADVDEAPPARPPTAAPTRGARVAAGGDEYDDDDDNGYADEYDDDDDDDEYEEGEEWF